MPINHQEIIRTKTKVSRRDSICVNFLPSELSSVPEKHFRFNIKLKYFVNLKYNAHIMRGMGWEWYGDWWPNGGASDPVDSNRLRIRSCVMF